MDPYAPKPRAVAADPVLPVARLTALGVTEAQLATIQATFDAMDGGERWRAVRAMDGASDAGLLTQLGLAPPAVVGGSLQGTPEGAGAAKRPARKAAVKKTAKRG